MTHDQAIRFIMARLTVSMLAEFKPDDVDLIVWLNWAADMAVDIYDAKHKAA